MALTVQLYKNSSDNNVLDKVISNQYNYSATLKDDTSVLRPTLLLSTTAAQNVAACNYMYIAEFSRYYFIDNIKSIRNNLWEIDGHVDVLMTYNTGIKNLSGVVKRNSEYFNAYMPDHIPVKERPLVKVRAFPTSFSHSSEKIILVVAGKGV